MVKNPPANAGDAGSIPGSGRCPGVGNGNPLQYSCPENSMDSGVWQVTVHGVAKSWARLCDEARTHQLEVFVCKFEQKLLWSEVEKGLKELFPSVWT